ncbi:MAG: alpha/beta fold hydrolase [Acidimicrobiales bacterium]|nr:alpha/beta fold hydrolase [Acidimicrobiales bacterium]
MSAIQHTRLHGHDIAYRDLGDPDGEVLVLIHGMAGSSTTWREVLEPLAQRFRVIAPDLLGHGRSAKPAGGDYTLGAHASLVRDLLAHVGVEHATIVGQSLGGGVAMQFAYQYPELCERLVLVNSGGLGRDVSLILRLLSLPGAELLLPVLAPSFIRDTGNNISRWLHRNGVRPPRVAEMWSAYASLAEGENRHAFLRTLRSVIDPGGQAISARDRLYLAAAMPTLIIWGDNDPIIPHDHGVAAHEAMPGSELVLFADVGHFPHVEVPEQFVDALVEFVDRTEAVHIDADARRRLLAGEAI